MLSYKNENILIDCAEGTHRQFKVARLNPFKLTRILITHWHGDHVLGIPGLLQTLAFGNYGRELQIYGPNGSKKFMNNMIKAFMLSGKINFKVHEVRQGKFVDEKDFTISALKLKHYNCLGYRFEEKDFRKVNFEKIKKFNLPGPLIGKLQRGQDVVDNGKKIKSRDVTFVRKGKSAAFIFDSAYCSEAVKLAKNADLVVSEATFSHELEDKAKKYSHMTARQAGEIAKKARAKKLVITHMSDRYKESEKPLLLKEVKKLFPNTLMAKDFLSLDVK